MRPKAQEQGVRQASKQVLSKEWKELERMRRRKWAWAIRKKNPWVSSARKPLQRGDENTLETMHTIKPFSSMLYVSMVLSS